MQKKRRKLIAAIGIVSFLAVGLIVGIYFHFGMIGPGLPPSINGWYFPSPDGKTFNGTRFFSNTGSEHFGMIGEVSASCPSLFPSISSDCLYGEFERYYANSSPMPERYIVISWYFNSTMSYRAAEQYLFKSLKENGNVSAAILDIGPELQRRASTSGKEDQYSFSMVPVTRYVGNGTEGYFISYQRPLMQSREDNLIMYYGALESGSPDAHSRFITVLMVEGGFPDDISRISGLMQDVSAE